MLNKLFWAWNLTLITLLLWFAVRNYYAGNLFFMMDVFVILFISATLIYRWQVRQVIHRIERDFDRLYQRHLEAMGENNGGGERAKVEQ